MAVKYKLRCIRCRKNFVPANYRTRYVVCYECQKKDLEGEIKDPKMKKLFDIPDEFYKENAFLRNIKVNCLKYGKLTDKQIEAFKKVVKQMKEEKKD